MWTMYQAPIRSSGPRGFIRATLGKQRDVRAGEPKRGLWPFFILKGGECPPFGGCLACAPPVQFYVAEGETGLVLLTPSYRGPARSLFIHLLYGSEVSWKGGEKVRGFGAVDLLISAVVIAVTVPILVHLLAI